MVLLGLKDVADIKVGGELVKGISGGEKRRLSLAVESEQRTWTGGCAITPTPLLITPRSNSDQQPVYPPGR